MSEILLHYTRGGKVESQHRADVAVVDVIGKSIWEFGDSKRSMFWRSASRSLFKYYRLLNEVVLNFLVYQVKKLPLWYLPIAVKHSMLTWLIVF